MTSALCGARAWRTLPATSLLALLLLAFAASPAAAHAVLQTTTPNDGAELEAGPTEVRLQFDEPMVATLGAVRVYDDDGSQVDEGDAGLDPDDDSAVRVALPDGSDDGTYVVSYNVISADSHPINGAFVFGIGEAESRDSAVVARILEDAAGGDPVLGLLANALRAVTYAGALLAVGGVAFLLLVHDRVEAERRPLARIVRTSALVALATSLAGIAVQGALVTGLGARALADPQVLGAVAGSSYGTSALTRAAGLALVAVAVGRLWDRTAVAGSAGGGVLTLAAFALTGHTLTTEPRWLVSAANLAHTGAGAVWFGGLVLLLVAMRRRRSSDDAAGGSGLVARFSTVAGVALVTVAVAGSGLAWAQVRAPRALWETGYGWTLMAKLVGVAAVVAVGAYNRRRLVPAVTRGAGDAWAQLQRTVRMEVAGILVVVAVTAILVTLVPAREAAGVTGPFTQTVAMGEAYELNVTVDPNRAGENTMHLYLFRADDRSFADEVEQLSLELELPANDIAAITREPTVSGPGHWTLIGPELSIPGQWELTARARVSEFDEATATIQLPVG